MKLPLPKAVSCHISDKGECESHWFTGVWIWSIGEVSLGLDATPSLYSVHQHPHCQCHHQVRSLIVDFCSNTSVDCFKLTKVTTSTGEGLWRSGLS